MLIYLLTSAERKNISILSMRAQDAYTSRYFIPLTCL